MKLASNGELEAMRLSIQQKKDPGKAQITVCSGTGCNA